jgi:hypothetical protein
MCDVIPVQWFWEISLLLEIYIKCTNEEKKKNPRLKQIVQPTKRREEKQ